MTNRSMAGFSLAEYSAPDVGDYVICEMKYDSRTVVPPDAMSFAAPSVAAPTSDALNEVLGAFAIESIKPLFGETLKKKDFTRRMSAAFAAPGISAPDPGFALSGFVAIVPEKPKDSAMLVERLSQAPGVWRAYLAPRPEPAAKKVVTRSNGSPRRTARACYEL